MGKVAFPLRNVRKDILNNWHLEQLTEDITVPETPDQYGYYTASLVEVPASSTGTSVIITGLTEYRGIPVDIKTGELILPTNQFYVNYNTGEILFHNSKAGSTFTVRYYGKGSLVEAEDVNDVNDRTETVERAVETVNTTLDTFRTVIDSTTAAVSAMSETVDLVESNVNTINDEMASVKANLDDKADTSFVEAQINETKDLMISYVSEGGEVDRLIDSKMVACVSDADYAADVAEREVAYDAKYAKSDEFSDLSGAVAENTENIASNLEKINANVNNIQEIRTSINQLGEDKADKSSVAANSSAISELRSSVATVSAATETNRENISNLSSSLSTTNANISAVSARVETIESDYLQASDLEPFATKEDLGGYVETSTLDELATKEELEGYVQTSVLPTLATKSEIADMATKTDLEGYVETSVLQDLATKEDLTNFVTTEVLDELATKEELEGYVQTSVLPTLATKSEIADMATKSDLDEVATKEDLENYVESDDLDSVVAGLATKSDLEGYVETSALDDLATKTDLEGYVQTSALDDLATKSDLEGYVETGALDDLATKSEIADMATKTDLEGYAEIGDLDDFATKADISDMATKTDLEGYVETTALDDLATKDDLEGYVETSALDELATKSDLSGYVQTTALDELATKSEIADMATKSDLDGYVETSALQDFATRADISDMATKSDLEGYVETTALDDLATKSEIADMATKSDLNGYVETSALDELATKSDISDMATKTDLEGYVETGALDELATKSEIADMATKSDLESYVQTDALDEFATKADISDMATKADLEGYVDIAALDELVAKSELDNYVQTEVFDSTVENLASKDDLTNYVQTETLNSIVDTLAKKEDISDMATKEDLNNYVENTALQDLATKEDLEGYVETSALDDLATKTDLSGYVETSVLDDFATKQYVGEQIDEIEIPDVSSFVTAAYVDAAISNSGHVSPEQLSGLVAVNGVNASPAQHKIVTQKNNKNRTSMLWNESSGGGAMFTNEDAGKKSFIGVNNGDGDNEIWVQGYAKNISSNVGTRITLSTDGFYYTKNQANGSYAAGNEVVTQNDLTPVGAKVDSTHDLFLERIAGLEMKIADLSRTNIDTVPSTAQITYSNSAADVVVSADATVTQPANITAKTVEVSGVNIASADAENAAKLNITTSGKVTIEDATISGAYKNTTGTGAQVNINNNDYVEIRDCNFTTSGYNGIEIGLSKAENSETKGVIIDNCIFTGPFANNAISVFDHQDDAIVKISNCTFDQVSNVLRISNMANKKATFIFENCEFHNWESYLAYSGAVICQDWTSQSVEEAEANNLFAPEKIRIKFINCIGPDGNKIVGSSNPADYSGSGTNNQLLYVYADKGGGIIAYNSSRYPEVTFA